MSQSDDVLVGRYRLLHRIGSGGMGVVWRARDERLGREVAVKRLHTRTTADAGESDLASHRAMREARITARLHHAHVVPVFDVVEHEGEPCLIMQYFPSASLAEVLAQRGRMPVAEVARMGAELASALAAAHRAGIVHRDVKPANVLIAQDGTTKITDFGIAHAMGDVSLTTTGLVTGTPAYLSPEVAKGADTSPASDVFSLGATLYAALEGQPPFGTSENAMALLHMVASGDVVAPQRAGALTPLLLRMLAVQPGARPSMDEVAEVLSASGSAGDEAVGQTLLAGPAPTAALPRNGHDGSPVADGTSGPTAPLPAGGPSGLDLLWPPAAEEQGERLATDPAISQRAATPPARRRAVLAVLGVAAVAAALGFGLPALQDDESGTRAAGPTTAASPAAPPASSAAPSSGAPTPTASASPTTTPKASSTPSASSAPPVSGTPTARELSSAVQGYYALLPGDLDPAWERLTERYQRTTAKNRSTFSSFWGGVDRVRTSKVTGTPPGTVTATITYDFDDGRVFVERTRYGLVEEGGVLKIDRSEVLSSAQR